MAKPLISDELRATIEPLLPTSPLGYGSPSRSSTEVKEDMRHLSQLLVTLALVAAPHPSAHGQRTVKVEGAEEYAVYSFIVNRNYTSKEEPLTISEDGLAWDLSAELSHLRALVREGQLSQSLVDDFEARNKAPFILCRQFEIKVPYLLRPTRLCAKLRDRVGLERYRAKCPGLSGEMIVLSRVGFNADKTQAVVLAEEHSLDFFEGSGCLHLLIKRDGKWERNQLPTLRWES